MCGLFSTLCWESAKVHSNFSMRQSMIIPLAPEVPCAEALLPSPHCSAAAYEISGNGQGFKKSATWVHTACISATEFSL